MKAIFDEFEEATDKRKKARLVLEGVRELESIPAAIEEEIVYQPSGRAGRRRSHG
ncbi:hypothetical protein W02_31210 [Nitrospira sp. KM1]|uniref:hypothetical protein n=1 Tax=Nitrospira sp. KM1 TaxID=1936990 RepID=UPI0013A72759|nr:hypothetical protein [Nitrospira sp. KM1]BCA55981.1 hypothetical protein W02_31210 [Nitrospira sp. KM1]